jgi:hypothetical protein
LGGFLGGLLGFASPVSELRSGGSVAAPVRDAQVFGVEPFVFREVHAGWDVVDVPRHVRFYDVAAFGAWDGQLPA